MKASNKEVRQLIRELEQKGWVFVRMCGTGHFKMRHPSGGITIIPNSPSDGRWIKNKRAEIRRIENGLPHAHRDGKPYSDGGHGALATSQAKA